MAGKHFKTPELTMAFKRLPTSWGSVDKLSSKPPEKGVIYDRSGLPHRKSRFRSQHTHQAKLA